MGRGRGRAEVGWKWWWRNLDREWGIRWGMQEVEIVEECGSRGEGRWVGGDTSGRGNEGEKGREMGSWRGRGWRCCDLAVAAAATAAAAAAAGRQHASFSRTRQGEAAVSAAARGGAAAAEAAVSLLPCSSLSSHLRGRVLLSFFK